MKIDLFDLVNCLSDAIDLVNPRIMSHHKRVAYIAYKLAVALKIPSVQCNNVFITAMLHDIGAIAYTFEEQQELEQFEIIKPHKHSILGYLLVRSYEPFSESANIIRFHHVSWKNGAGSLFHEDEVPLESHIIHLADRVDILIDRNRNVLDQINNIRRIIKSNRNSLFHPEAIDRFLEISQSESFWLDITSPVLIDLLHQMVVLRSFRIDIVHLQKIAKFFSHIIDFRSQFTATHSSGVAVSAEKIAQLAGLPERQASLIGVAGYLHDVGKLAVPNSILDKEGVLTPEEFNIIKRHTYYTHQILNKIDVFKDISRWASSHHEKLDGTGYPFRYNETSLDIGSRIMAVADIFTALTEDRPYRKGMQPNEVMRILKDLAARSTIDRSLVALLEQNYNQINQLRKETQARETKIYVQFWSEAKEIMEAYLAA